MLLSPEGDARMHGGFRQLALEDQAEILVLLFREQVIAHGRRVIRLVTGDDDAILDREILGRPVLARVAFPAVEVLAVEERYWLFAGGEFDGRRPVVGSRCGIHGENKGKRGADAEE